MQEEGLRVGTEQLRKESLESKEVYVGIWVEKLEGDVNEALKP